MSSYRHLLCFREFNAISLLYFLFYWENAKWWCDSPNTHRIANYCWSDSNETCRSTFDSNENVLLSPIHDDIVMCWYCNWLMNDRSFTTFVFISTAPEQLCYLCVSSTCYQIFAWIDHNRTWCRNFVLISLFHRGVECSTKHGHSPILFDCSVLEAIIVIRNKTIRLRLMKRTFIYSHFTHENHQSSNSTSSNWPITPYIGEYFLFSTFPLDICARI